jgi:hypothetical protein
MSVTSEPEPVSPHDPMHDAPRRLREEPEQRLAAADEIRALRRQLDSHAMGESRALAVRWSDAAPCSVSRPLGGDFRRLGHPRTVLRHHDARGAATG